MLRIGSFVWGVLDLQRAMTFWKQALHYTEREAPSADWVVLVPEKGRGPQFALMRVRSASAQRHHLDLYADDQAAEVERLVALGASRVPEWKYEENADYVVLKDPEGNPFCVALKPPHAADP